MRWQGGLETMAQTPKQRAADRGLVARRLVGELAPHKATVAGAFAFVVVNACCQAAGPWLVGHAIDHDIAHPDLRGLGASMLLLFGVYVIGALSQWAQSRRVGSTGQHVLASLTFCSGA